MNRIPFSVYDFFGYLASGFLFMVAVDYVIGKQWVLRDELSVVLGLFWIVVAYIIGQILAGTSAWLLERLIVGKWLMRPYTNLLRDSPKIWWAKLFPGYFTPFPVAIRNRVKEKAKADGVTETGEAVFLHVFGEVKADEAAMARLNIFLNLYGFCRNISFTCLLVALVIVVGSWIEGTWDKLPWFFVSIVGSVGMFYRYLKFFRQYSYELFITYAALPSKEVNHGD